MTQFSSMSTLLQLHVNLLLVEASAFYGQSSYYNGVNSINIKESNNLNHHDKQIIKEALDQSKMTRLDSLEEEGGQLDDMRPQPR